MSALLQCLSHTPLVGYVDPPAEVLAEVDGAVAAARDHVAAFAPDLVVLFAPDHFNGFFYDVMPPFCVGVTAYAIGDFHSAAGTISTPPDALTLALTESVMNDGVDVALSQRMQVDHGFAQPLEFLLGGLDKLPVVPIFVNGVAPPLPTFKRARLLGEAVGRFVKELNRRVLFVSSGGLSHQPPVPEYATASEPIREALLGGGKNLSPEGRAARTNRTINAAKAFVHDQNTLHPLNPEWDQAFLETIASGRLEELDGVRNDELSVVAGRSVHEVKTWLAASAAMSAFGPYDAVARYYRPIPEWIAGFGALTARQRTDI